MGIPHELRCPLFRKSQQMLFPSPLEIYCTPELWLQGKCPLLNLSQVLSSKQSYTQQWLRYHSSGNQFTPSKNSSWDLKTLPFISKEKNSCTCYHHIGIWICSLQLIITEVELIQIFMEVQNKLSNDSQGDFNSHLSTCTLAWQNFCAPHNICI